MRPYRYELDPTGVSPDNYVVNEVMTLVGGVDTVRAAMPEYGAFFSDTVTVYDVGNSRPLVKDEDFYFTELYELPTAKYGREICAVILFVKNTISSNVRINYQALGGEYSYSNQAVIDQINQLQLDNRNVAYKDIIGKPEGFNPTHHLHDIGDVYGFEYITLAIDRVRQAILLGDRVNNERIFQFVKDQVAELDATLRAQMAQIEANPGGSSDSNHQHPYANDTSGGFMSPAMYNKLLNIQANATKNNTDLYLLSRNNHVGTQPASTITGLANVATTGNYEDLLNRPNLEGFDADNYQLKLKELVIKVGASSVLEFNRQTIIDVTPHDVYIPGDPNDANNPNTAKNGDIVRLFNNTNTNVNVYWGNYKVKSATPENPMVVPTKSIFTCVYSLDKKSFF